jgi:hypothetical protein
MDVSLKQARRDLNPQPPDLESGALAVRATGPSHRHEPSDNEPHRLFRQGTSVPRIIVFRDAPYAFGKSDNTSCARVDQG